jgi:hypothetical protein
MDRVRWHLMRKKDLLSHVVIVCQCSFALGALIILRVVWIHFINRVKSACGRMNWVLCFGKLLISKWGPSHVGKSVVSYKLDYGLSIFLIEVSIVLIIIRYDIMSIVTSIEQFLGCFIVRARLKHGGDIECFMSFKADTCLYLFIVSILSLLFEVVMIHQHSKAFMLLCVQVLGVLELLDQRGDNAWGRLEKTLFCRDGSIRRKDASISFRIQ